MTDALPSPLTDTLASTLTTYRHAPCWWIACSGGVDSLVLLHATLALTRIAPGPWPVLRVIHINHQLHPQAADWAQSVERFCVDAGVDCVVRRVDVKAGGLGLEAAAREARYAAFESVLNPSELLLQAHHHDDQSETVLLRLLRGSGVAGLAGIPAARTLGRGQLVRPLLAVARSTIVEYARQHALQWVEDDSNADARFDRNFLRQRVLPLLGERWPGYRDTLARVAQQAAETAALLRELAEDDLRDAVGAEGAPDDGLDAAYCLSLSSARQANLVRGWLAQRQFPMPSRAQLEAVLSMLTARCDAQPCVRWPGVEVRRFRGRLYALPPLAAVADYELDWQPELQPILTLPADAGALLAEQQLGAGLRTDRSYRVRNRRGGERCHPLLRVHSQTLKKLLQEDELAPWWRERVPLIYCGTELAAVGDLWVCRGFEAEAGTLGWLPRWLRPDSSATRPVAD